MQWLGKSISNVDPLKFSISESFFIEGYQIIKWQIASGQVHIEPDKRFDTETLLNKKW